MNDSALSEPGFEKKLAQGNNEGSYKLLFRNLRESSSSERWQREIRRRCGTGAYHQSDHSGHAIGMGKDLNNHSDDESQDLLRV